MISLSQFQNNPSRCLIKRATETCNLFCNIADHSCKTSWIAMLRVLPPIFKSLNNLICCQIGLMWVVKRATLLFNSFCRNAARQVAFTTFLAVIQGQVLPLIDLKLHVLNHWEQLWQIICKIYVKQKYYGWCRLQSCTQIFCYDSLINTAFCLLRCGGYSRATYILGNCKIKY